MSADSEADFSPSLIGKAVSQTSYAKRRSVGYLLTSDTDDEMLDPLNDAARSNVTLRNQGVLSAPALIDLDLNDDRELLTHTGNYSSSEEGGRSSQQALLRGDDASAGSERNGERGGVRNDSLNVDKPFSDMVADEKDDVLLNHDITSSSQRGEFYEEELEKLFTKYEDFQTIDWLRDISRERERLRHQQRVLLRKAGGARWLLRAYSAFDACSGWLCVFLVGVCTGLCAALIDIGGVWLSDLKDGVCVDAFWLNKEQCCWAANDTSNSLMVDRCSQWYLWSDLLGIDGGSTQNDTSSDSQRVDVTTTSTTRVTTGAAFVNQSMSATPLITTTWFMPTTKQDGFSLATQPHYDTSPAGAFINYVAYTTLAVLFSLTAALFVKVLAPYACGSGIPEIKTMLSGFVIHGYLGKWTLVIKTIGLMLTSASGLCIGKEGPMVHVGACCGNLFAHCFAKYGRNEAKKREILSAASAAGVAVAFGAPTGGVIFSLEEISYYFPLKTLWRSFFCALSGVFVLRYINPFGNERSVFYSVEYKTQWYMIELFPIMLVGVCGGIWGAIFIKANVFWCKMRKTTRLGKYPITEVFVCTLITALLAFWNPYTKINSLYLMRVLVSPCSAEDEHDLCDYDREVRNANDVIATAGTRDGVLRAMWQLALALLFRCVLTIVTIGIKVPTGLFIPNMVIGAILGRMIGVGMEQIAIANSESAMFQSMKQQCGQTCVNPALYAMIGAAAALGGVTRMTVSLVVIMLEVTGGLNYVVPLMVAVMFSKWVGDWLCKDGINEAYIALNGYPFLDHKLEFTYTSIAADIMRPRPGDRETFELLTMCGMTVEDVEAILQNSEFNGFPVIVSRDAPYLVGFAERRDLKIALDHARKHTDGIVSQSPVYFGDLTPSSQTSARRSNMPLSFSAALVGAQSPSHDDVFTGRSRGPDDNSRWSKHEPTALDPSDPDASESTSPVAGQKPGVAFRFHSQYPSGPKPLHLNRIVNHAPVTVTERTPVETLLEMFRKLGLRQTLVTKRGKLAGIITKKDMLRHIMQFKNADPHSLMFT